MNIASVLVVAAAAGITAGLLVQDQKEIYVAKGLDEYYGWRVYGCILIGLAVGILIGMATEYFTSYGFQPTKSITLAGSMGGAATVIIQGLGVGMLSTLPPVFLIIVAIISCAELAGERPRLSGHLPLPHPSWHLSGPHPRFSPVPAGVYGISMAAVGMLSTLGVTLATDAYGPVADNAGGIAEMTEDCPEYVRERTDKLDALGNTTAATGKGFAIGSAVLTALAFLVSYAGERFPDSPTLARSCDCHGALAIIDSQSLVPIRPCTFLPSSRPLLTCTFPPSSRGPCYSRPHSSRARPPPQVTSSSPASRRSPARRSAPSSPRAWRAPRPTPGSSSTSPTPSCSPASSSAPCSPTSSVPSPCSRSARPRAPSSSRFSARCVRLCLQYKLAVALRTTLPHSHPHGHPLHRPRK